MIHHLRSHLATNYLSVVAIHCASLTQESKFNSDFNSSVITLFLFTHVFFLIPSLYKASSIVPSIHYQLSFVILLNSLCHLDFIASIILRYASTFYRFHRQCTTLLLYYILEGDHLVADSESICPW